MTSDHSGARSPYAKQMAWQRRNGIKVRAHRQVKAAKRRGLIERQACEVCGDPRSEGHHPDYGRPLLVMWLCRRHHKAWHRENVACVPVIQGAPSIVPDADPGAFPYGRALNDEEE